MTERTWDSLTEEEQQDAIKEHSRFRDPVQARKNWEAHERTKRANARSYVMAAVKRSVSGWEEEDGTIIPKTVEGIARHKALVARVRAEFPRLRLNHANTQLRYKAIIQKAEQQKRNAEAGARFKREAAQREKDKVEREKRIAAEKEARIIREASSALKQAKEDHERLSAKVLGYEKAINVKEGQIARTTARIAEIERVLPSYVGSSLYFKMKKLLPPARRRLAYSTTKLGQYQGLLKSVQVQLKDTDSFLQSEGVLSQPAEVSQEPPLEVDPRVIDLIEVRWRRRGRYLYPRALVLDNVKLLNIWVRPAGTGKLRIFSDQPLRKEIDWVVFKDFKLALTNPRKGFFCADLTAAQVNSREP